VHTDYVSALVAICTVYCALQIVIFTLHYVTLRYVTLRNYYYFSFCFPQHTTSGRILYRSSPKEPYYSNCWNVFLIGRVLSVPPITLRC